MKSILPILTAALLASPATAQSNATTELMSYGDVIGQSFRIEVDGHFIPITSVILIPSFLNTGSNFLVGQTGDPNDQLAVALDLAMNGTYFTAPVGAGGRTVFNLALPNNPALLDRPIYWQALGRNSAASGAGFNDGFSNLRTMSVNGPSRWQETENRASIASSNLASCTWETGFEGLPTKLFVCGGGPALLVDVSTPYPTINRCWEFDGVSGEHTILPGTMTLGRAFHQVVKLQDGRFMAIGGIHGPFGSGLNHFTKVTNTCEIYDPATGTWTATAPMGAYRAGANATVLPDGRVYVVGGTSGNNAHELHDVTDLLGTALKSTEFYDPATDTWSWGPSMHSFRAGASAVTLPNGKWLVSGGVTHTLLFGIPIPDFSDSQELYDPSTNSWGNTGNLRTKRALGGMTLLANGEVLIAGGGGGDIFNIGPIRATETYNPATGTTTARPNLTQESAFNTAVALPDGRAMIIGGARGDLIDPIPLNNVWFYDPATGALTSGPAMPETHAGGVVTTMEDGTVYCGGGESDSGSAVRTAISFSP